MTETIRGETEDGARRIFDLFRGMITGDGAELSEEDEDALGDLYSLAGVGAYPTRIKCAMLGWHTVMAALDDDGDRGTVTTE